MSFCAYYISGIVVKEEKNRFSRNVLFLEIPSQPFKGFHISAQIVIIFIVVYDNYFQIFGLMLLATINQKHLDFWCIGRGN